MEFKVGDRVRLICCRRYGDIVGEKEILGTIKNYSVLFDNDDSNCLVPEEALEIVDEHGKTLLEQRIEKLEKCVMGEQNLLEKCENVSSMSKNGLLTEDERVILRNLDKDFKFIARSTNGDLNVFEKCPKKREYFYSSFDWSWGGGSQSLDIFPNLFQFIKNTDEPYNIEELLKGEE